MLRRSLPSVSILVAAFKAHHTIRRTIESALGQSYPHIEVVIAPDDGTTYSEIRQWCHSPRVRLLQPSTETGTGPAYTRNRAIDASRGDFFCVLDADDYITPGYIEALVEIAGEDGVAAAPLRYVSEHGELIRVPEMPPGIVTVAGFGQGLCSLKPLSHRSLEPGFCHIFAEDIVHDAVLLAKTGGTRMSSSESYETVVHPVSLCASSSEDRVIRDYGALAHGVINEPSALRAQALGLSERREIAELFEFRIFVSERFAGRADPGIGYHEFVRGREGVLWDDFMAMRSAGAVRAA